MIEKKLSYPFIFLLFFLISIVSTAQVHRRNLHQNSYRTNYQRMAAGRDHSMEIRNGTLWAWGGNQFGQLGDGTNNAKVKPVQIGNSEDWVSINTSHLQTFGIKSNGTLWAWGNNPFGQLGDGTNTNSTNPVQIGNANNWIAVSSGINHTLGLKANGTLWTWGGNNSDTRDYFYLFIDQVKLFAKR